MYSDKKLNLQLVKIIAITASFVVFSSPGLSARSSRLTRFASVAKRFSIGSHFRKKWHAIGQRELVHRDAANRVALLRLPTHYKDARKEVASLTLASPLNSSSVD